MKINTSIATTIILLFVSQYVVSQDFNFSQFENAPLYLNPALSGIYNGQHRLLINHRNESVDVLGDDGFSATSISYDTRIKTSKKAFIGIGGNYIKSRSGSLDFGADSYKLSAAYVYNFSKDPEQPQFISFGLDFGETQRTVDLMDTRWPSQHDGSGGFNPNLPPGNPSDFNFVYPDLGVGLVWEKSLKKNNAIRAGLSMHHINKANVSFLGNAQNLLVMYSAFASGEVAIVDKLALLPSALFLKQGKIKQFMLGSSARLYLNPKGILKYIQFGTWIKTASSPTTSAANTMVFLIETQVKKLLFAFSYDRRSSDAFTNNGLELSLGYTFN